MCSDPDRPGMLAECSWEEGKTGQSQETAGSPLRYDQSPRKAVAGRGDGGGGDWRVDKKEKAGAPGQKEKDLGKKKKTTRLKFSTLHFLSPSPLALSNQHYHLSAGISALILASCGYKT